MKKRILLTALFVACIAACAIGLSACGLFGADNEKPEDKYAIYHLNGGYIGGDPEDTDNYDQLLSGGGAAFKPITPKRETWIFDAWYFDDQLTEVYTESRFEALRASKDSVDLYAKWIDEVTVTKSNFLDYFYVTSRWNGGGTIGNAGISYSVSPKMTFDPDNSAESIELQINPVLTNGGNVVWDGGKSVVTLTPETDYYISGVKKIDSSGAGVKFDITGRTLDYSLVTPSFTMKLLHNVPMDITLELDGGQCESNVLSVKGCDKLCADDLPTPKKNGHKFIGWFADAQFETEYEDWVVTRPRTLYAKFVKEITVTYHMNGAEEKEAEHYLADEFIISHGDPVREGYKFFGFYTTPDFAEGSEFAWGSKSDEDLDLYARWEAIRTITFQTNGGSVKQALKVADTETPDLGNDPSKGALKFYGWYTDAKCTARYEPAPVTSDMTLYAFWMEDRRLTGNAEELKEYLDIQLTDDRIDDVLTLTLTVTIKEKYRKYGFALTGKWFVDLSDNTGANLGNGEFVGQSGSMRLSSFDDTFTATGVYTAKKGTTNNRATVFELSLSINYGHVYIPENGFGD